MNFKPTVEQEAILKAVKDSSTSIMIQAMAGCAKTTTLEMIATQLPIVPSLATAFNVKIKKEMERRLPGHFAVMTLNGLGHGAWSRAIGRRCAVKETKVLDLTKEVIKDERIRDLDQDAFSGVLALVRKARSMGLVPKGTAAISGSSGIILDTEEGWQEVADAAYLDPDETQLFLARRVLQECIKQSFSGVIDFDDQIYMSSLFGGVFPKYPLVMVDEAQDLSPLNHLMIERTAAGRLIVVGDSRQAIYAFRGADSGSMKSLRRLREEWIDLPLSTTFRCPKVIVSRQQEHAPGFTAAPSAPEGLFKDHAGVWTVETLPPGSIAILCRNNAPLMSAALRIIAHGHGCSILGREIGKALATLSKKLFPKDDLSIYDCVSIIASWRNREVDKALLNKKDAHAAIVDDKAECLLAVATSGRCKNAGELRETLVWLFAGENNRITLATGHKAKGLEWPTVVHLDPWRVPSKHAKRLADRGIFAPLQQENNLRYVIETRAQGNLILANLDNLYGEEEAVEEPKAEAAP